MRTGRECVTSDQPQAEIEDSEVNFRELDGDTPLSEPRWPLKIWYKSIRDTALRDFEVKDLARACQQELYPEYFVPLCLRKLQEDPMAGEVCDGELVRALKVNLRDYWRSDPVERAQFLDVAARAFEQSVSADGKTTEADLSG